MGKIVVLVGTSRKGNYSESVAKYIASELKKSGQLTEVVLPLDHLSEPVTARSEKEIAKKTEWSNIMESADGLVIVTPEYNHGYPGELKLMLDQLYSEYAGKPVVVCGVSDGNMGGGRVVENLLPVLIALGMIPMRRGVYFSKVDELFGKNGNPENESISRQILSMVDFLLQQTTLRSKLDKKA